MKVHSPLSLGPLLTVLDTICSSHSLRLCFHSETVHKTYGIAFVFFPLSVNAEWDCVACSFFIDTAHNVIQYLEKIHNILKPGGYWINLGKAHSRDYQLSHYICLFDFAGPLLYHFADMPGEFSIELSWEDIRRIAEQEIGFEILVYYLGFYYIIMAVNCLPRM